MLHLYHSHAAQCFIICGISCLCWEALTHSCHFIVESSRPLYLWTHRRISWQRILNRTNCIEILVRVYSFQHETGSWNLANPNQIHQIRIKLGSVMPQLANTCTKVHMLHIHMHNQSTTCINQISSCDWIRIEMTLASCLFEVTRRLESAWQPTWHWSGYRSTNDPWCLRRVCSHKWILLCLYFGSFIFLSS